MIREFEPIEWVLTKMMIREEGRESSLGFVIAPRYHGDDDARFCGKHGDLVATIVDTHSRRSELYSLVIAELDKAKNQMLIEENLAFVLAGYDDIED